VEERPLPPGERDRRPLLVERRRGDEVHDAGGGVGAVESRPRTQRDLDPVDLEEVLRSRTRTGLLPHHDGTFMLSSFGHLLGGYDAGYYGYLWAEVFGQDMFSRFAEEGVLSTEVGIAYRRKVLEPGGTRDAIDLLRDFLGREPRSDAFFRKLGLEG